MNIKLDLGDLYIDSSMAGVHTPGTFPLNIGSEVELLVLTDSFKEANNAQKVLSTAIENNLFFVHECSQCNVEFNSPPGSMKYVAIETSRQLEQLNEAIGKKGVRLVPVDFPLDHAFKAEITDYPRYIHKQQLIGIEKFDICKRILGTHVHFDLHPDPDVKIAQINFLALFDPLAITATATSRNSMNGIIINNWRVYSYRYLAHEEFPFQGDIQGVYSSYKEYVEKLESEYAKFLEVSLSKGVDFSRTSNRENAIWGPIRVNTKYNTVEMRSMSSHPDMITVFSVLALARGGLRRIIKKETSINDIVYSLTGKNNMAEASAHLKNIDYKATLHGFKSDEVVEYCKKLILFCIDGLEEDEEKLVGKGLERFWQKTSLVESIVLADKTNEEKYSELHHIYVESLNELKNIWS